VKDEYVESRKHERRHFGPEENILVSDQRRSIEEKRASTDHQKKTRCGPGEKARYDLRKPHALHRQAHQTQVDHRGRPDK